MFLTADFETEVASKSVFLNSGLLAPYLKKNVTNETRVVNPIYHTLHNGRITQTCQTFTQSLIKYFKTTKTKTNVYNRLRLFYHNLNFDFSLIKYELNTFNIYEKISEKTAEKTENIKLEDVASDFEEHYEIIGESDSQARIIFVNIKVCGEMRHLELCDSFLLAPMSLAKFTKSMGVLEKGVYDWKNHIVGSNRTEILKYCERDVISQHQAISKFINLIGNNKTTISSASFTNLKKIISIENFPTLQPNEINLSRKTYVGGYCYNNPKFENVELENVYGIDVNAMYSYIMAHKKLPYGKPFSKNIEDFDVNCYSEAYVYISYRTKENHHPFIRLHKSQEANMMSCVNSKHIKKSDFRRNYSGYLWINSHDIKTLRKVAYIDKLIIVETQNFREGSFLKDYILNLYKEKNLSKQKGDTGMETVYKLQLNSIYGKFAQILDGRKKISAKNGDYYCNQIDNEGVYMPMASAITSLARQKIVHEIAKNPGNFIYCDTDSIFYHKEFIGYNEIINSKTLGMWDYECQNSKGKFLGAKTYIIFDNKNKVIKVKAVGLNTNNHKWSMEKFSLGNNFTQIKGRRIVGGIELADAPYQLRKR